VQRSHSTSPLWAITSYSTLDDPPHSKRRLAAFREFRKRLAAPLVAVEFTEDDAEFDLTDKDAEILVSVRGGAKLWQKERLLNIALDALPDSCDTVAWVDCDLVFESDDWTEKARVALVDNGLVQLFRRIHFLNEGVKPSDADNLSQTRTLDSLAWAWHQGSITAEMFAIPEVSTRFRCTPGFAWAARRDLLERHRFYDCLILGGADKATLNAACGEPAGLLRALCLSPRQENHYLAWAERFSAEVNGQIGFVAGDAYHLWHGDIAFRGYSTRYENFDRFDFDPEIDIAEAPSGAWEWATEKPQLHDWARAYFESRKR